MQKKIEQRVSESILQKEQEITVGGETYRVMPPTIATLILTSELIAQLPAVKLDSDKIVSESLSIARNCRILGDIMATLILGAKGVQGREKIEKRRLFGFFPAKNTRTDAMARLSEKLIRELSPAEMNHLLIQLLERMQIGDFFGLTASLIEINLLRRTREAGMIAFGQ